MTAPSVDRDHVVKISLTHRGRPYMTRSFFTKSEPTLFRHAVATRPVSGLKTLVFSQAANFKFGYGLRRHDRNFLAEDHFIRPLVSDRQAAGEAQSE
ncbi:MAG: hypothetical protein PHD48_08995 [Alphaproteobacteria bacterium]|nr:hypothetical protein [Alphaproteobacteria bacterium]